MRAEQNERVTRIGPGTPCGQVLRHYWHPVALLDEFNPVLDPRMGVRAVKAVKLLGQDLVLFKNAQGEFGLLDRDCPHRGADLAYGRNEGDGLRCPFHGWKFDVTGQCLETPCRAQRQRFVHPHQTAQLPRARTQRHFVCMAGR
jgi:phthalate 4,5-dioxygenase